MVAGPAGFCLSLWLGFRAGRHAGQGSLQSGVRWGLHWLAFMAAAALVWQAVLGMRTRDAAH